MPVVDDIVWIQALAVALAGLLLRRRLVLTAFALAVAAGGVALGVPADALARPWQEVAPELWPVAAALAFGLVVAAARRRRLAAAPRLRPDAPRSHARAVAAVLTAAVVATVSIGLYVDDRLAPWWRAAVDDWLATSRTVRLVADALGLATPAPAAPAGAAAKPAGAAPTKPAGPTGSAATKPAASTASTKPATAAVPPRGAVSSDAVRPVVASTAPASTPSPGAASRGAGAPDAGARPAPRAAALPGGDLRHCLERGGPSDVLRCAEQGR